MTSSFQDYATFSIVRICQYSLQPLETVWALRHSQPACAHASWGLSSRMFLVQTSRTAHLRADAEIGRMALDAWGLRVNLCSAT